MLFGKKTGFYLSAQLWEIPIDAINTCSISTLTEHFAGFLRTRTWVRINCAWPTLCGWVRFISQQSRMFHTAGGCQNK